ncbi:MAG: hypothetical protein IPG97_14150 [Microthrixaceae bacterium]|nr:hypothetical protein [Microthrixaceae bacterium]
MTRVVVGSDLVSVGDRVNVMVQISPMFAGDEKYAEAARPGIEAAIFGYRIGPADGWFASVEGFTVACEGGPLMGWTGFRNAWADLTSVDEVLDAAGSGGLDGPVVHAPPADRTETNEALIQGTLELDDKCLYVVSVDPAAQRYPLVWPYGTYWEPFGPSVHSPDFPAIAVGDEFTAGGSFGSDPAALGLPPAAVEHVTSCLDSPTSEIAYVQTVEGD